MSEDDPFEHLDAPEDREGDPFEQLGDAGSADESDGGSPAESATDSTDSGGDGGDADADDAEPAFEEEFIDADGTLPGADGPTDGGDGPRSTASAAGAASSGDEDDPFAGMSDREGDPFGEGESAFETVDVESLDADEVWESLADDEPTPSVGGSRYVEVSKHRYCEQCEHFAEPPAAHCTHEEAEIIEYLDMETVRLLDCPVVAEQRQLNDEE